VVLTLQPVGAVLLAMLILGESPNAMQLLGASAILAGLLLATVGRRGVEQSP
jgi:drug/metabolite transporter (DMT)-like permease